MKKVPCEVYSRIVGYLRPINNWNPGKKAEWEDRKMYNIDKFKINKREMKKAV